MSTPPKALSADRLFTPCDPAEFSFKTTAELEPLNEFVGQDRAVEAVRFGIGMRHKGYNLYVLGEEGVGKRSLVRRFLEQTAVEQPVPNDWCYVNNFTEPHRPKALELPPGKGRPLKEGMERLMEDLGAAIPAAFESDEFRNRKSVIGEQFKERHEEAFQKIQDRAEKKDVALIRTPVGLALAPVREGEVLNPQEFEGLTDKEKKKRKQALENLQTDLEETLQEIPMWEKEQRELIRELIREVTRFAVDHLINELKAIWKDHEKVIEYLNAVSEDVVENASDFLPQEKEGDKNKAPVPKAGAGSMRRYSVNVVVDNAILLDPDHGPVGAPVIEEDHPTQANLVGRIEHLSQFGTLVTDFNLIKAGALHRANGGYLVLDIRKVLMQSSSWETLKRSLKSRRIRIESAAEALGWSSAQTLEPEPIRLDVKVVLMGEPMLYYLLNHNDPDFGELFKVAADFETRLDRSLDTVHQYAQLIAAVAEKEGLKPLDRTGVARVVEHGARLADDSEKLTAHMGSIADLVREADFWARNTKARTITAKHVQKAIDAKLRRSDRVSEHIREEILRGTFIIETEGAAVGQINGLSVIMMDSFAFGRPSRITCRVRLGKGDVVDIEREVALGGPLHSKGVLIMSSYLATRYAREKPLSLNASLVFEQSYGGIEGDSASSAELYALLSAVSQVPIKQCFAVTGSVDQTGRVQAIGGVNEKIEGFFDICRARGLTGEEGVLVPATNVKHLMLRADVVVEVKKGRFHIYAVETIDQGLEILTGLPAGEPDAKGQYPIGSINRAISTGLERFTRRAKALASEITGQGRANGRKGRK